jgi:hypothetical protein
MFAFDDIIDAGPSRISPEHHNFLCSYTSSATPECADDESWTLVLLLAIVLRMRPVLLKALEGSRGARTVRAALCVAAVRWGELEDLLALLNDNRVPTNRGWPLREAVKLGRRDCIEVLLGCPRVDPNRGTPLYYAVVAGDVDTLRLLLTHPRTRVNRCTYGVGSTALCQAVICQREDMVDALMRHPGTNVNKGYLLSPLQLAVHGGNVRMVELVLSFPDVVPEKVSGESLSPIRMALDRYDLKVFKALLRCDRFTLSEDVFDVMEEGQLAEFQQTVIDCQRPLMLGRIWRRRVGIMTIGILLTLLLSIAELSLAYFYAIVALQETFGVLTLLVPTVVAPLLIFAHQRYHRSPPLYLNHCVAFLQYLPLFPMYHMVLFHRTVSKLFDEQDVYCRERYYSAFQQVSKLHATCHAGPQLILQIIIALMRLGDPGGGEIISAIGRVPYEAQSVPYNYVLAVVTSSTCMIHGGLSHWKKW